MAGVKNQLFAFFFSVMAQSTGFPYQSIQVASVGLSDCRGYYLSANGLTQLLFLASPIFSSDDPTSGVSSPESSALFYLSNSSYDSPSNEGIPTHQWLSDWWNEKSDTGVIGTIDVMMKIKHTSGRWFPGPCAVCTETDRRPRSKARRAVLC